MNIGILTLPLNSNYGGVLQAYALQKYLIDLGFNVVLLNRRNNENFKSKLKKLVKSILYRDFVETTLHYNSHFIDFIQKKIPNKSPKIYTKKDLEHYIEKNNLTHIIVGSDQVWRCDYSNITDEMFLNIGTNIRRGSYAASFGFDKWCFPDQHETVKTFLKKFNSISVREDSGIKICRENFEVGSEMHVDPTMLLSVEHYISLIKESNEPPISNKLLTYILDSSEAKSFFVEKIAKKTSLTPYMLEGKDIDLKNYKSLKGSSKKSIHHWLRAFYDSDFVVTDSYHGTLFALLFNKPFLVLANQKRGVGRFTSILRRFNLEDRLVVDMASFDESITKQAINFKQVNEEIEFERLRSKKYLLNFLNDA